MALKTYNAADLTVTFGPVVMSGFGPDTVVSVEMNEDLFTLQVGADGHATRSKTSNRSARITVTLAQSSMANDLLSGIAALDAKSNEGVYPLLIKDGSGRSIHSAKNAWITRVPTAEYGKEAGTREWVFETDCLDENIVGGN